MAALITEITARLINARAAHLNEKSTLNALLDQETAAKAAVKFALVASRDGKEEVSPEKLAGLEAVANGFASRISAQRKLEAAAEKDMADIQNELDKAKSEQTTEDAALAVTPSGRVSVKENSEDDPKRGFRDHRDFLKAVMVAGRFGKVDNRLKKLASISQHAPNATQGSDEQGTYSDPVGNYLVPSGVMPGLLKITPESDPLQPFITHIPMSAPTVSFNARVDKDHTTSVSGGLTVTRRPETVDGTSSRMTFEQVTLTANEEFGLAFATERIIHDSPESFIALISAGFNDEFVAAAMKERLNGTGVGERLGVLRSPALISVAKETGQVAATIKKENIDKMAARSWKYNRAVWLANHNTLPQLLSIVQAVGTGGTPVPYFTWTPGGQSYLLGRPIFFSEFAKTVGTQGDLILCVWSEYLEATFEAEQFAESIHVRFASAERAFRFYRRNDGQPWWRAVLTPANGDTLSPIVVLDTRA